MDGIFFYAIFCHSGQNLTRILVINIEIPLIF